MRLHLDQEDADFDSYHIEGFAREGQHRRDGGRFKVPLISHVHGNLWQGGCRQGAPLPEDFMHVISLFPWERYELGPKTSRVEIEMYDAGSIPHEWLLHETAEKVNECCAEGKTLVHCQAGLNRSGLVAGLALIKGGMAPADAITLLRDQRSPMVLCNRTFAQWLMAQ